MPEKTPRSGWRPEWTKGLGFAVWVTSPEREITYLNRQAEEVLELSAEECVGLPCYQKISLLDIAGKPFCSKQCPLRSRIEQRLDLTPIRLQVKRPGARARWIHVLPFAVTAPDGGTPWVVHCAIDAQRAQAMLEYIVELANRKALRSTLPAPDRIELTVREVEILELLALDHDLCRIAEELHITYHTVRNHVQNLLPKLDAHSISQAVAIHLLHLGSSTAPSNSTTPPASR